MLQKGIDLIMLFRVLKENNTDAFLIARQTEHSIEKTREAEAIATKSGKVQNLSEVEYEVSLTTLLEKGDVNIDKLEDAFINGDIIEIWEVNKAVKKSGSTNEYKAEYLQGYITKISKSANSEDNVELELEFAINGTAQKGYVTLNDAQANVVQYMFANVTAGNTRSGRSS